MAPDSVVSRLRYLDGAAHLLSVGSPAVSAQLLFRYGKIASENDLNPSDARKRSVCGACGSIMVPGWTCHVRSQSSTRKKGPKKSLKKGRDRPQETPSLVPGAKETGTNALEMVYECRVCGRATRQTLPKKPPPRRPTGNTASMANPSPSTPARLSGADAVEPPNPASANASSRKRAKARKQGGLQALLAKRKEGVEHSSDFGLDLMDFMKKA